MHKITFLILGLATPALAEAPVIAAAQVARDESAWRFDVTLSHPDTGWDHYADGWRVEDADGAILGTRTLLHPHVNEQPFTRSLGNVVVPPDLTEVFIRAKCSVDGWSTDTMSIALPD
ncbi:hypothetical protein AN189_10885 [Loktanella sp. 3ANDIMAR09]|uniref:hypothetical protein n=1 Tax=Loktanella sp. 3ANDIMAR09 TaxID=1225657 RepID=UPI0006FA5211|nr:hypothetical protein [Loktanella sp. 3ANDIMAR09]KQI68308.1 hypothetical protein AN189_10885 [Loktanella sp. 3ANDIMAR09]